jgi:hypothetical protein
MGDKWRYHCEDANLQLATARAASAINMPSVCYIDRDTPAHRFFSHPPPQDNYSAAMCERKPSQSLDARTEAESPLPLSELSHSNIRLWNDLFTASSSLESVIHTPPPESAPPVPTESPALTSASDSGSDMGDHPEIDIIKLRVFNIWVNSQTEMPQELREHVKDICSSPRLKPSPAGKNLSRKQQMAQSKKERTAIDILQDDLLFKTEAEGDEAKIVRLSEACLERLYNPPTSVFAGAAPLPQAICDTAICYITPEDANTNLSKPALTFGEEIMVGNSPSLLRVPES